MNCVICLADVTPDFNWNYLFSPEPTYYICDDCKQKLAFIEGERCTRCSRPLADLDAAFIKDNRCQDCCRWEENPKWAGVLEQNTSLFLYNDFLKETIARFKYRGDYEIAGAFSLFLRKEIVANKVMVPIPLSDIRRYERGFNQAEAILTCAGLKATDCLARVHSEKQSKKSRKERLESVPIFKVEADEQIIAQNILLVDDIYTTGATLCYAAKVLKEAGAKSVSSFTVAR